MSKETYEWLANNVAAGFVTERPPWWSTQIEGKHLFEGGVPLATAESMLTSWTAVPFSVYDADMHEIDGYTGYRASDTGETMNIMSSTYVPHDYGQWLVESVSPVLSDEVQISTLGLLKRRLQAWLQLEMPQQSVAAGGVKFAPYVLLSTSLDASIITQVNRATTNSVCDNTMNLGRSQGLVCKVKSTKNSLGKLGTFREVLRLLLEGETEFTEQVNALLDETVDERRFERFMDTLVPVDTEWTEAKQTRAKRKRQEITELYRNDERAASWRGTAWGVLQAVNTWDTHMSQLRNMTGKDMTDTDLRAHRNFSAMAEGRSVSQDSETLKVLAGV